MRVALVHDWLCGWGGAEQVLLAMHRLFPQAPIYTSVYLPETLPSLFRQLDIRTSFLQRIPGAARRHRLMLPLMPLAFEAFDLRAYDLVLSSSHACAKGVITGPETVHVSYLHTPIRYAWDMYHAYREQEQPGRLKQALMHSLLHYLRLWDQANTTRVDQLLANSAFVKQRIAKYYRRDATVIYPPVELPAELPPRQPQAFYLAAGRLVPYKRTDLIIDTFNANGLPLKVAGGGPLEAALRKRARPNIEFLGEVSRAQLEQLFSQAQAMIFAALEDFGILPVEAQAFGCPVIAFGQGGALETVVEGQTGLFFEAQTVAALQAALERFQQLQAFDPALLFAHSQQFSQQRFADHLQAYLQGLGFAVGS